MKKSIQKINELYLILSLRLFDQWEVDIIKLLPIISKENQYITVIVEYLSK